LRATRGRLGKHPGDALLLAGAYALIGWQIGLGFSGDALRRVDLSFVLGMQSMRLLFVIGLASLITRLVVRHSGHLQPAKNCRPAGERSSSRGERRAVRHFPYRQHVA
jgi:uncharacterized membrane protein AbrB (regulator of aidB expression)